jgi:hypothetical protein
MANVKVVASVSAQRTPIATTAILALPTNASIIIVKYVMFLKSYSVLFLTHHFQYATAPAGLLCRPSVGDCDQDDFCDGLVLLFTCQFFSHTNNSRTTIKLLDGVSTRSSIRQQHNMSCIDRLVRHRRAVRRSIETMLVGRAQTTRRRVSTGGWRV